jgi:hypothetical protein
MPEYQFLFHNTRGAVRFEDTLKTKNIKYKIMPPPVQLDNCCGISIRLEYEKADELLCPDVREVYLYKDGKYEPYYSSEKDQ